ncbi:hypothetical protein Pcinc_023398 [Petrolisthes cinctipes]|uniref:Uncharacterized protein n=1 Tax=Petrolisthes cinctipes TaxID=88211 RepID=A0AAE1FDK9_PETCI|nr:hypothetical protein Pcinc_023398 [Petrolisthes cinctipes]
MPGPTRNSTPSPCTALILSSFSYTLISTLFSNTLNSTLFFSALLLHPHFHPLLFDSSPTPSSPPSSSTPSSPPSSPRLLSTTLSDIASSPTPSFHLLSISHKPYVYNLLTSPPLYLPPLSSIHLPHFMNILSIVFKYRSSPHIPSHTLTCIAAPFILA